MIPLHHLLRKCMLFLSFRKPDSIFLYLISSLAPFLHPFLLPFNFFYYYFLFFLSSFLLSLLHAFQAHNPPYMVSTLLIHQYVTFTYSFNYNSDTASRPGGGGGSALHPAITATASVALWNVLHNSEQARALARGAVQDQGGLVQMPRMCETRPYSDAESKKRRENETSALHLDTKGYPYERQRGTLALADSTHRARLAVLSLMESEGTRC